MRKNSGYSAWAHYQETEEEMAQMWAMEEALEGMEPPDDVKFWCMQEDMDIPPDPHNFASVEELFVAAKASRDWAQHLSRLSEKEMVAGCRREVEYEKELLKSQELSFHFRKLWGQYEAQLALMGERVHAETARLFAVLLKWRAEEQNGRIEWYSRLAYAQLSAAVSEKRARAFAYNNSFFAVKSETEAYIAAGLSAEDLRWSRLLGRESAVRFNDLHQRFWMFAAFCAEGCENRQYWSQVIKRCMPSLEAMETVCRLVYLMSQYETLFPTFLALTGQSGHLSSGVRHWLVQQANPKPEEKVVDLFCGDGTLLVTLQRTLQGAANAQCSEGTGLCRGYTDERLPLAEMNLRLQGFSGQTVSLCYADAPTAEKNRLEKPQPGSFDVVVNSTTGAPDWRRKRHPQPYVFALEQTLQALRPGGRAVMLVPASLKKDTARRGHPLNTLLAPHRCRFEDLPPLCLVQSGGNGKGGQPLALLLTKG